ncbi:MAG: saccharopine dehydrogenase NADP-binding domain-containing protein [Alphaproteobacteria bacterium]|nr:saccharopine dehydrogenase NADP-binding domain-containing protein [Alphaproteobacteria bacterium]
MTTKLGLIGEGISRSRAPRLHEYLGGLHGLDVTYELFDLLERPGVDPFTALQECCDAGLTAVNVTHPFKGRVAAGLPRLSEGGKRIGTINTVLFEEQGWIGYNTDFSGFKRGYDRCFGDQPPGSVLMVGAGGVGRAVAFALHDLKAERILIIDVKAEMAEELVGALREHGCDAATVSNSDVSDVLAGADGVANCTPIGMHQHPGTPISAAAVGGQKWAFDAVYTPLKTEFIQAFEAAGVPIFSGFELFYFQGLDAYEHFTGTAVDADIAYDEVRSWMDDS